MRAPHRLVPRAPLASCAILVALGCSASDAPPRAGTAGATSGSGAAGGTPGTGGQPNLSVGSGGSSPTPPSCKVLERDDDALPPCITKAPPDAFAPIVQWSWTAPHAAPGTIFDGSLTTPLVGNFTDDNGDGAIDLCDTPDVLVVAIEGMTDPYSAYSGRLHLLAGDTGVEITAFADVVDAMIAPAFGDIDGDGLPEVVTADPAGHLVAYEHTGELAWTGDLGGFLAYPNSACTAISLHDLDGDGHVEILAGFEVFDALGHRLWGIDDPSELDGLDYWCPTPTAADLDGDGELEVLFGHATYHADGTLYWKVPSRPGHPHVGNFDADPEPEVFLTTADGLTLIQHDGAVSFFELRPTEAAPSPNCWGKPGVIHDFDGDGLADVATGTCSDYSVYDIGAAAPTPVWSAAVSDTSGLATGTAFDFLGDGVADAIYADETHVYVFDGTSGAVEMTSERKSATLIEYPVVADIDNDGSAEVVYVSNYLATNNEFGPTVTALRDAEDRWIPARRIWNQHAYHVTNVREDGTIPAQQKHSWQRLNTFRTNSQVEDGADCDPGTPK